MATVLRVSDAAAMGVHAMVLLEANRGRLLSNHGIASALGVSEAHLSKVLQRLVHAGLVSSLRGPGGGFALTNGSGRVTLLEVYEEIEGPLRPTDCLLSTPICGGKRCIFGGLLGRLNRQARDYLAHTTLAEAARRVADRGGREDRRAERKNGKGGKGEKDRKETREETRTREKGKGGKGERDRKEKRKETRSGKKGKAGNGKKEVEQ